MIAVTRQYQLSYLRAQSLGHVFNQRTAAPIEQAFILPTDAPAGTTGENQPGALIFVEAISHKVWSMDSKSFCAVGYWQYMTTTLAIDTATDACSIALHREGDYQQRLEIAPRQHNQLLFKMLAELLPAGGIEAAGIELLAFGSGPGSFTGLRIAASAIQGLAYAGGLPVVAVSTLACQVQGAYREGLVTDGDLVLSTVDAQVGEVYAACYEVSAGQLVERMPAQVCKPEALRCDGLAPRVGIGSGLRLEDEFPGALREALQVRYPEFLPQARDLIPLALDAFERGEVCAADQVVPCYVRDEVSWKKISEQGVRR